MIRTITLLRFLSEPELREQITAITNKVEAFHGFSDWLMFGGELIGHNDPDHQEKMVKFNELLANCVDLLHRPGHHRRRQRARRRGPPGRPRRPGHHHPRTSRTPSAASATSCST